jgi:hypothetical protein
MAVREAQGHPSRRIPTRDRRAQRRDCLLSSEQQAEVMTLCSVIAYSVMTVDCPEMSNRLRQRMFLQAITSSLRTM